MVSVSIVSIGTKGRRESRVSVVVQGICISIVMHVLYMYIYVGIGIM